MISKNDVFAGSVRNLKRVLSASVALLFSLVLIPSHVEAQSPINLGTAIDFAVLADAGITNTGPTTINGDLGTFPTLTMTGLGSVTLVGTNQGGNAVTQVAQADLLAGYNDAAGRIPTIVFPPIQDLGGQILAPGVYNDTSSFGITGTLTLDGNGDPNAVWIFQAGSTLVTAANSMVNLINGAQAGNIFWQVGSSATLGVNSSFTGTIMATDSITLNSGATLNGQALSLNGAVTLDSNLIIVPAALPPPTHWLGATNGLWTNISNWASDVAGAPAGALPSILDNITFSATGAANQITTLGANFAIQSLTINDTAAVTIGGANILTIAGNNAITANVGAGAVTISSDLVLTGPAAVVAVHNAAGVLLAGLVTVPGTFDKNGVGALTVTGSVNVAGSTAVNAGTLNIGAGGAFTAGGATTLYAGGSANVGGTLQAPSVNVLQGANLSGDGTVIGNVSNLGAVNPGNGVGALTIQGNFMQAGAGTLVTQLIAPNNHDQLTVSGLASLGGTLQIATAVGYLPQLGDSFDILTAGGLAGQFGTVINPFSGPGSLIRLSVEYIGNTVFVNAVQNSFQNALSPFALTPNQQAVVAALDSALNDPRQVAVLNNLNNANILAVPALLDQLAPEELAAMFSIGFAQMNTQVLSVQQRLQDIRAGGIIATEEVAQAPAGGGKGSVADLQPAAPMSPYDHDRYGFFVSANGDYASIGSTANANGFDLASAGTTLGMDMRISDHFVLGLTLGYARSITDLTGGGSIEADGIRAAIYTMYQSGGFYAETMVGAGYSNYETERSALGGLAQGSTTGTNFDAYYGMGYDIHAGPFTLTPMASLLFSSVGINDFDETGSLQPLHIDSQREHSLRSRIGLRAAFTTQCGAARVTPSLGLQWQHEYLNDELGIDSSFANGAGAGFTTRGPRTGRDSALITTGLNVAWSRYAVYFAYQADLGRQNYESHSVLAGFRVSW